MWNVKINKIDKIDKITKIDEIIKITKIDEQIMEQMDKKRNLRV